MFHFGFLIGWCIRRTLHIPRFGDVLQELGISLGDVCLTVKNYWRLLTGDDVGDLSMSSNV